MGGKEGKIRVVWAGKSAQKKKALVMEAFFFFQFRRVKIDEGIDVGYVNKTSDTGSDNRSCPCGGHGFTLGQGKKAHYFSEIPAAGGANNRDNENGLAVLLADARGKKPMLRSSVFHTQRLAYLCVCGSPEK